MSEKGTMINQNLIVPRRKTVRTQANILAMENAVQANMMSDPLDRQLSIRDNPVLRPEQRESARKIIKYDLGHDSYSIRKVCLHI